MTSTGEISVVAKSVVPKECVRGVSLASTVSFSIYVKGLVKVEEEIKKLRKNQDKLESMITKLEKKMSTEKY